MFKELNDLQVKKRQLVEQCVSQRYQVADEFRTLEQLSQKITTGWSMLSSMTVRLRWILPFLPIGFSLLFVKKRKSKSSANTLKNQDSPESKAKPSRLNQAVGVAWKLLAPGGIGWRVIKILRSMKQT
ncbi:MAG: hypothetical protein AAF984_07500 [Verrucomicrobiota bacterium]